MRRTVKVFSVGFGPELVGFNDRNGTRWRLSAIPLGGYVRFLGDENEAGGIDREAIEQLSPEEGAGAFAGKGVSPARCDRRRRPDRQFCPGDRYFHGDLLVLRPAGHDRRVDEVTPGSAAERAGFQAGDVVVSIDGKPIANFSDLQRFVRFPPVRRSRSW